VNNPRSPNVAHQEPLAGFHVDECQHVARFDGAQFVQAASVCDDLVAELLDGDTQVSRQGRLTTVSKNTVRVLRGDLISGTKSGRSTDGIALTKLPTIHPVRHPAVHGREGTFVCRVGSRRSGGGGFGRTRRCIFVCINHR
jgi:hypothetical protein